MMPHLVFRKVGLEEVIKEDIDRLWSWLVIVLSVSAVYEVGATVMRFRVRVTLWKIMKEILEKNVRI